jgi:hypothetical protein
MPKRATGEFQKSVSEPTPITLGLKKIEPNPAFRYTTPSHLGKRREGERRSHGCIEEIRDRWCYVPPGKTEKGKKKGAKCFHTEEEAAKNADGAKVVYKPEKKFNGKRCRSGPREACKDTVYDAFCAGSSDPCGSPRSTCPVQLVWVDGKPNLRFCRELGKPGHLVPVSNISEAMKISDAACAKWPYKLGVVDRADGTEGEGGWDPEFFDKHAPEVLERAKRAYPESAGFGALPRRRGRSRRQQASGPWLAIGLAMGVGAAVLLKRQGESG